VNWAGSVPIQTISKNRRWNIFALGAVVCKITALGFWTKNIPRATPYLQGARKVRILLANLANS